MELSLEFSHLSRTGLTQGGAVLGIVGVKRVRELKRLSLKVCYTLTGTMENMQYAEELAREFIIFRGFTNTLQVFEKELSTDVGRSFQVDKIMELVFSVYVPKYQSDKLISLLTFFKQCFSSSSDIILISTLLKLELSILRYYIVHALLTGRSDKVVEFFSSNGNYLLQRREEWLPWFAVPYINNPSLDPEFCVFFSKDWFDVLQLSFHNFLSEVFNGARIPALMKLSTEKNTVMRLKNDLKQLNQKLSELQALLEVKEAEILSLRSIAATMPEICNLQVRSSMSRPLSENFLKDIESNILEEGCRETSTSSNFYNVGRNDANGGGTLISAVASQDLALSKPDVSSTYFDRLSSSYPEATNSSHSLAEIKEGLLKEDEFPEVSIDFQETFLGHTSQISRCRFSASGSNVASASVDGTVRIWTYGSSTPTSRNATIYCGAEIMSLEWESRSDRLLLIGTADGGIKAWNVDAKRVVCDLSTSQEYPSVVDLKCSPVEPIFVSAAASKRHGVSKIDQLGFASLTVWNMKTWKAMATLPLGKDPPAITSLSFNHNGKILAASATDGMIHMFDMSAGLQITGWPAHDSTVSSVLFGPDETSIFSLGSDGKIFEWSLQNQGQVLWSRDCSRFCYRESEKFCRHEIALDSTGKKLLVTSGLVRSPIYQVQEDHLSGFKTLAHTAAVTSVDWHPTLPIFITGSADHSVRVTSIL